MENRNEPREVANGSNTIAGRKGGEHSRGQHNDNRMLDFLTSDGSIGNTEYGHERLKTVTR